MAGIEEAVCIQLAKFNDTEKSVSNARWSNHNKQPVTINQGDSISITKSFIDTRNLSSAGITILVDTPLELELFFYWINDGNPGSTSTGFSNLENWALGNGSFVFPTYTVQMTLQTIQNIDITTQNSAQQKTFADGRPYLLCYSNNSPFTQTWRYTLPKGTYTPDALASLLTTNMAEVKKQTAEALNKPNAVDWFDPFAPKVNLPKDTTLDQPFIVNTNSNSPLWNLPMTMTVGIAPGEEATYPGVLNSQQFIQIDQNNGVPDWYLGTSGSYTVPPGWTPSGLFPDALPIPPVPSLTFKNIISDCPIPNASTNLPPIPSGEVILASHMIVGLSYQIVTLGNTTDWLAVGDLKVPPSVGDEFECISVSVLPNPTIGFLQMALYKTYQVVYSGLPWTGPGGFDTNWAQYSNNGTVGSNFATNAVQPTVIAITNDITLINLNITYTISASTNIDWTQFGAILPSNNPIAYTAMNTGSEYEIVSLGLAYAPGGVTYDTDWAQLGDVETTIAVGNVFTNTKQYNIPIPSNSLTNIIDGITFTITDTSDLINWGSLGWTGDPNINNTNPIVPVIDPILLVGFTYKIVSLGVYYGIIDGQSYYDTNWLSLTQESIPNPPAYTTPVIGDRFLTNDVIDVVTNINNGALLNIVPNGQTLLVTNAGDINWSLYGDVPDDDFNVLQCIVGVNYTITNVGYMDSNPNDNITNPYDTDWYTLSGNDNIVPSVGLTFTCASNISQTIQSTSGSLDTADPSIIPLNYYQITDLGTLSDLQWLALGAESPATVGEIFQWLGVEQITGGSVYYVPTLNIFSPSEITIITPGQINWTSFGAPSNNAGTTFVVNNIPSQGSMGIVPNDTVSFKIIINGRVKITAGGTNVPFEIAITSNPGNASPTDTTFEALTYPTGTVQLINSYQSLLPFTFKATATGVNNPNENYTYAGEVIGTGTVKSIAPTFPFTFKCTEIPTVLPVDVTYSGTLLPTGTVNFNLGEGTVKEVLNINNPNFYIYPLKLVSDPYVDNTYFNVFTGKGTVQMYGSQMINYNFPLVGSTQIQLSFNDAGNLYQWNYTHSPILQATAPTASNIPVSFSEVVGIVNSFIPDTNALTEPKPPPQMTGYVSSTCKLVAKSGCMFRRMEPQSFWFDTLGFSRDLIVTDKELGLTTNGKLNPIVLPADLNRFTYERFNNVTTRSLLSTAMNFTQSANYPNSEPSYIAGMFYPNPVTAPVQSLNSSVIDSWYDYEMAYNFFANIISNFNERATFNGTSIANTLSPSGGSYQTPPQWNESWYQALDQTVTIPANKTPTLVSDTYGHYLIEIEGYQSSLLNEQQKYGIKAIVSSYYNNIGSFTSLPFNDEAFLYQHVGESITLNNFRVRILDGKMKEVEGLGDNSCVYLQITKSISQIEVQQV